MRSRHAPEQMINKLRRAEVELAGGATLTQVCNNLGITEHTFHRWRRRFGKLTSDEARRLQELQAENACLKRQIRELAMDKEMLQAIAKKKW